MKLRVFILLGSILAGALFVITRPVNGQDTLSRTDTHTRTDTLIFNDTIKHADTLVQEDVPAGIDTLERSAVSGEMNIDVTGDIVEQVDTGRMKKHSPRTAWICSAVVPGLGQVYNRKYWKVPIIYAAGSTFYYFFDHWNTLYYTYKSEIDAIDNSEERDPRYERYSREQLVNARDGVRRNRDLTFLGVIGVYALNVIDAMVDAHFFYYDVSPDLSMRMDPALINSPLYANRGFDRSVPGIRLSFRF